jgi:hypothetical protein
MVVQCRDIAANAIGVVNHNAASSGYHLQIELLPGGGAVICASR